VSTICPLLPVLTIALLTSLRALVSAPDIVGGRIVVSFEVVVKLSLGN
jgi:hypothetical protein